MSVTSVTPEVHLSVTVVIVKRSCCGLPLSWTGSTTPFKVSTLQSEFAITATHKIRSAPFGAFVRKLSASGYPFTPPASYMGELPKYHDRTLTGKSCVLHGIPK